MPAPAIDTSIITQVLVDGNWTGGSSLVLTYSAAVGSSVWPDYGAGEEPTTSYSAFTAGQANAFYGAMELWDSYVAASFNQTTDLSSPGTIRVAFTGIAGEGTWGYAYLPNTNNSTSGNTAFGDIWVDSANVASDFAIGSYDYQALLHEIGHALGLDHSFFETGDPGTDAGLADYDNYRFSIMSYSSPTDGYHKVWFVDEDDFLNVNFEPVVAKTPMIFDIFAVQSLYGADTATRAGATTYTFDANEASFQTIYDAGGIDTWDLSGHTRPSYVDLTPAAFSSIDFYSKAQQIADLQALYPGYGDFIPSNMNGADTFTWTDNVAIAYGTIIENVTFGSGNDTAIGNSANNVLIGNGGNDVLNGGAGADTLTGGIGDDLYYVDNIGDIITEGVDAGLDTVSSSRSWAVGSNFERVYLTGTGDFNVAGNGLANVLRGNSGDNWINGSFGKDILTGGGGRDSFIFNREIKASNVDTITDYDVVRDVIRIDNAVFTGIGAAGALAAGAFNTGAAATQADDRIIYDQTTGKLFFDIDGVGGVAQQHFATLSTKPTGMTAGEFIII